MQCIRDVHNGRTSVAPAVAAKLASRLTRVQLTTRELEVLKLIAEGEANKEIGAHLHIAESTVKLHVNTLFEKLQVTSRTEAMKVGLERGSAIRLRSNAYSKSSELRQSMAAPASSTYYGGTSVRWT